MRGRTSCASSSSRSRPASGRTAASTRRCTTPSSAPATTARSRRSRWTPTSRRSRGHAAAGPCLVNAGGDLAVRGGSWPVAAEHLTLVVERGALATSGRDRRRWRRAGREQHHLIDPATGAPADTEFVRVTVVAATAVEAEVLAKAVFLGDEDVAARVPCVLVRADGTTAVTGGLA